MPVDHQLVITCPLYCEDLVVQELILFGAQEIEIHHGAVKAAGTLECAYRICLWSRIANKVLLNLVDINAASKEELYETLVRFPFALHFSVDRTFVIDSQIGDTFLSSPNYANLIVKDAVADSFRRTGKKRPNVDTSNPDIRFFLFLENNAGTLSIDISGSGLFKRSYRKKSGEAPLKENVAAAILLRAGWIQKAHLGGALVDLMCGSGTFLVEGLLAALDLAPGVLRDAQGPMQWKNHDVNLWKRLVAEAVAQKKQALAGKLPRIIGYDVDRTAVSNAEGNLKEAGLRQFIEIKQADFRTTKASDIGTTGGLVVANPPYGHRMGDVIGLKELYADLGRLLISEYRGFSAAILAGDRELARAVGLRAAKLHTLYNGPIRCTLAHFELTEANKFRPV
jgi:23S rRNA (guanine2445-N2)-methyltransferase / 23S rRNA (guanine2069-N7)-methyltransferase